MTKQPFRCALLFLLICFSISVTATAQTVNIPDPNLRAAIENQLGKPSGATITTADMASLTRLSAHRSNISDLTGLETALNLTSLTLDHNSISDISPVEGLTNLTTLALYNNSISDISPVEGLTNLTYLSLGFNYSISDISPVEGLTNLTQLLLSGNSISDISAVARLTNLTQLLLTSNSISDISPVEDLTNLTQLWLGNNSISDISAVARLTNLTSLMLQFNSISDISVVARLTNLTQLLLTSNSISDISVVARLTNLTQLLLTSNSISDISPVEDLTNLTQLWLGNNSISDISAVARLTNLTSLMLQFNSISDISAVARLTHLTVVRLDRNSISDISPLVENTGLGEGDEVNVKRNPLNYASINTHIPTLQSRGVTVEVGNIAVQPEPPAQTVNIPDPNLRAKIEQRLGKPSGDTIITTDMAFLTRLDAQEVNITDLTGLETATNLTDLWLSNNSISDISPLSSLTNLTNLGIGSNSISDISPLVENTGLGEGDEVDVRRNPLNPTSINTHIPALQSRGVKVQFDDIVAQPADVNGDGTVNILDLVSVASKFGTQGQNLAADVNRDGIVDILDLVFVAGMFGDAAAAPSAHPQAPETLTAAAVRQWLTDATVLEVQDPIMKRGIRLLEQLLASLTPTETELLANYPNPFNPETWIPYRLAEDAFVTLTIYDLNGQVVRTLDIGHRTAAVYENRSKAIYWEGRNNVGEQVASGVYFYHLSAGDYSATRKMLILK